MYRDEVRDRTEQLYCCKFETNEATYAIGSIRGARLAQGEMVMQNGNPHTREEFAVK